MNSHLLLAIAALGVNVHLAVLGCVSPEDRQRRGLADEFNKSLGKYKESLVIEVGPPQNCTPLQNGGGEVCEWQNSSNVLRYRYDASGIARNWTYTDRQLGYMEGSQEIAEGPSPKKKEDSEIWQSVKDAFTNMKVGPGGGSTR